MQSDFDLRYNISALAIAILKPEISTVEQAFRAISTDGYKVKKHKVSNRDVLDMLKMRKQGMTYKEIGKIYGMSEKWAYKKIIQKEKDQFGWQSKKVSVK